MSASQTDTVRLFMKAMENLDYEKALSYVSEDVEYTNMPLGPGSTLRGHAGILSVLQPFFAPTITNEWIITSMASAGNTVFMERLDRHQLPRGWAELPVTGVFEVVDGKISSWREYFDYRYIEQQMTALTR